MIDLHTALIDAKRLPKTHMLVVISSMHYQHMSHRNGHASLEGIWKIYQYAPLAYKVLTCSCPPSLKGLRRSTNVIDLHISQWRRTSFQWRKWIAPRHMCLWWQLNILKFYILSPNIKFTKFLVTKDMCCGTRTLVHLNLHNATLSNVTPLLHPKTPGNGCAQLKSPSLLTLK